MNSTNPNRSHETAPLCAQDHGVARLDPAVDFETAVARLESWKMFDLDWVRLETQGPPEPGRRAVVDARVAGFRIKSEIEVTRIERSENRYELRVGTRASHPLRGEESFVVARRERSDGSEAVDFELRSTSVPRAPLVWIAYPILRYCQRRFARDAAAAMRAEATSVERRTGNDWHGYLRWSAGAGFALWLAALAWIRPSPRQELWGALLLVLAALVFAPWLLTLAAGIEHRSQGDHDRSNSDRAPRKRDRSPNDDRARRSADHALQLPLAWRVAAALQLPAALALGLSFALERGALAAAVSAPWLITTAAMALVALLRVARDPRRLLRAPQLCMDAALAFPLIGAAWTTLSRLGARPLDFSDQVVLLTGVHFHYAGLALPLAAALALRTATRYFRNLTALLVVAGTPLVAAGITLSQVANAQLPEAFAAWTMALGGLCVAALHAREALRRGNATLSRCLFGIAALSLAFGMLLAIAYGSRNYIDIGALDFGWMRALHGSANALGFSLPALAAWLISEQRRPWLTDGHRSRLFGEH